MKVEMRAAVSGTRDGMPWPVRGQVVDLPDSEAAGLIASGLAVEVAVDDAPVEMAVKPERRKRR